MRRLFVAALLFFASLLPAQVTFEGPITIEAGQSGNLVVKGKKKPDVLQPVNPPPAEGSCGFLTSATLPSGTVGESYSVQLAPDASCLLPLADYAIQDLTGVTTWTAVGGATPDFNETFSEPAPCALVETTTGGPTDWPLTGGSTIVSTGPLGSICQLSKADGTTHVITGLGALSRLTVKGTFRRPTGAPGNIVFAMMDASQNTLGFVRVNSTTFNLEVRSTGGTDVNLVTASAVDTTYTVEFDCVQSDSPGSSFCRASINGGAFSANATGTWTAKIDGVRLGAAGTGTGDDWAHGPITMCHAGAFLDGFCAGGAPDQWSATSAQPNAVRLCDSSPCAITDRMDPSDWSWVAGTLTIESAVDPDTRIVEIEDLPFAGGSLSSTGLLSGTPTTDATYTPLVRITDALGNFSEREFSVTIAAEPPPQPPATTTYYVAPSGDNSRSCTTAENIATPKQTINNALACLQPGEALDIRAGTYVEAFASGSIPSGTDWDSPVILQGHTGETVTIRPSGGAEVMRFGNQQYIILDNLVIDGVNVTLDAIKITVGSGIAAHHIRIQNSTVKNAAGSGISLQNGVHHCEFLNLLVDDNGTNSFTHGYYISDAHSNLIDNNIIEDNFGYGGKFDCAATDCVVEPHSNILRNSIIRRNSLDGSRFGWVINTGENNQIYNNVFHENAGGVQITNGGFGNEVDNNTFWNNNAGSNSFNQNCLRVFQSTGSFFRNNICYQHDNGSVVIESGASITQSNNLLGTNPLFDNAAGGDFQVQAGSPAIDAGLTIPAITEDFDGVARPQGAAYDIGAYEQ